MVEESSCFFSEWSNANSAPLGGHDLVQMLVASRPQTLTPPIVSEIPFDQRRAELNHSLQ